MMATDHLTIKGSLLAQIAIEHQDKGHKVNLQGDQILCFDCETQWRVEGKEIKESKVKFTGETIIDKLME